MPFLKKIKLKDIQDNRSKNTLINIFYSFGIKGISVITYLLLVPITLKMLNPAEYGIWLTLSSILMWINTFDIGFANGLRNKLAEAIALNDIERAKSYIITTYISLAVLVLFIYIIFIIVFSKLDWYRILNTTPIDAPNLNKVVVTSFGIMCLTFVFKTIGNIYLALQKTAMDNLLVMLGQVLSLVLIYYFGLYFEGNLYLISLIYTTCPLLVFILIHPIFFFGKYKYLLPNITCFKFKYVKDLMGLGVDFFLLQIGGLIIFSTSNLIITNIFGPENVTSYNIVYRYFSLVPMLFSIILTPVWSATTDAYVKGDLIWIRKSIKKVNQMILFTGFLLILMVLLSKFVFKIWIGENIKISLFLTILMSIYIYVLAISISYSTFINGIGKLRIQVINTIISALLFIPLAFFFAKRYDIYGITVALILVNLLGLLFNIIQFNKIINNKAAGIWNK